MDSIVWTPTIRESSLRSSSGTSLALSLSDMRSSEPPKFHILIAANGQKDVAQAEALIVRLSKNKKIEARCIADTVTPRLRQEVLAYTNDDCRLLQAAGHGAAIAELQQTAFELCEWADMLVVAPIDANTFAKMLHGMTDNLLLQVLRGWDVSKKILLVPGMSTHMWENPMTKKQLNKVRRKWNWIRVLQPILWQYDEKHGAVKVLQDWDGFWELEEAVKNQAELMTIGHDVDIATSGLEASRRPHKTDVVLPPEIWSIILNYVGDWELAQALGVYTTLPVPSDWKHKRPSSPEEAYLQDLEWTLLSSNTSRITQKLAAAPSSLRWLSTLSVKLIIKFCLTDVLSYLETNLKDIFWASFGSKLLPTKASTAYGRTEILEWWRTSPSFLSKDYTVEAMDGASKAGFVHVLDWWRKSGLPLKYTEAALEQASSKGHILVLEWWKEAAMHQGRYHMDSDNGSAKGKSAGSLLDEASDAPAPLRLKVGKSILCAAQNGQAAVVRWWDASGIPYSHSESVAKIASAHGHVNVLDTWRELKGEKMSFDAQVLVGPTKNCHTNVLEWWKRQGRASSSEGIGGLRVEYKTCDIEEALEDCIGKPDEEAEVRKWWARNGLNLGVGTSEWMKVKTL